MIDETTTTTKSNMTAPKIFTVNLIKRENGGLGFLIRQRAELPYFAVCDIIKNGAAEASGCIRKGDLILKVNNQDLTQVNYINGLEILKSIQPGNMVELTLLRPGVANNINCNNRIEKKLHKNWNNLKIKRRRK